jgi:hypothetical protein
MSQGGLSLERDLLDWFGQDRLAELLDGAAPSEEEAAAMARLTGDPVFFGPTESDPEAWEPIVPEAPRRFPASAVIATISSSVAARSADGDRRRLTLGRTAV